MGLQRRIAAGGLLGVLALVSACGAGGSPGGEPDGSPRAGASSPPTAPARTEPAAAPSGAPSPPAAYAVEAPGPREGALSYADILVAGPEELDEDTVAAVRAVPGVTSVARIALAQVSLDNRLVSVAAVDPASYRNFVAAGSADTQAVWDRVAGGEIAVDPRIRRRLPIDEDGYVRLGSDRDAPRAHVGAFAEQIEGAVDVVVNEKWIEELAMTPGNALLVSTTGTAPQAVDEPLRAALGADVPVQFVDAVARFGLDPGAPQTAVVVGATADAVGTFRYTVLAGGRIAPDPAWVSAHITTEAVPILGTVTCNRLIFPQLRAALEEVVQRGLADRIHPDEYAGCYYPRFIAGSSTLSNHAFGLALDLNVPGNGRGSVGAIDRTVVSIFKKWGFGWGGDWKWTDPMHFEMNALVDPR
ncbi:M15 family metallopeptidase [Nocardioides pantholopis]|uniref:M15 family metallopeptidase n=1 Tax=Nocardioides pantholopis TaxID=2483798 RepID=UPI000F094C7E|nr:M15 family metallopeptidase [Nocardioides pantholopis]